ncbi:MAG: hypothetical protein ACJ8F7_15080, partial [Gemmataceae bacterium]
MKRFQWLGAVISLGVAALAGAFLREPVSQGQNLPPAIPAELTSYRDVVKRVLPAVVSIEAKAPPKKAPARPRRPENFDRL